MPAVTPFLQGLHLFHGGRKALAGIASALRQQHPMDVLCATQLQALFAGFLPSDLLKHKGRSPAGSRSRIFTPTVTFWAFLGQVLDPGSSCRKAVARVQALFAASRLPLPAEHTGAYCEARVRLPVRWLMALLEHVTTRLGLGQPQQGQGQGRLLVVDGTTVALPDTAELQARYPQSEGQKPGCGFPLLKLLGLFDLHSGAWLACTHSGRKLHDARLWRRLFHRLRAGDTVLVDRAFCGYFDLARLMTRGVEVVVRLHAKRHADFRQGKRLGKRDHLVVWPKPARPAWMSRREFAAMPDHVVVRELRHQVEQPGHRTRALTLATTLIDEEEHSRDQVAALYARRWQVELFFDDVKTTMHMEMLRTRSTAMVCRELLMHMIAYNLLRALIVRSGDPSRRASFKGTVDRLQTWQWVVWLAPNPTAAAARTIELLDSIASDRVPERPGRREPRAVKRRPKPHPLLTKPRHLYVEIRHRSHYRKAA
jgi:hypothetical protein